MAAPKCQSQTRLTIERQVRGFPLLVIHFARAALRAPSGSARPVVNPATGATIAQVTEADADCAARAIEDAQVWDAAPAERAAILRRAADLYEDHFGPIFAILGREGGKALPDAVGELREAVDFLRYYAAQGQDQARAPRGIVTAISPWNFPLAIFTGQIAAALMAGNAVLAKPAEQTPLIAHLAVTLLHQAGVPRASLQFLPGDGSSLGAALTRDPRIGGVVFTGSTETARIIARAMADAATHRITGKAVTPYLLQRIYELTGGRSLEANIALVLNNARLGAAIARELASLPAT